MRPGRQDHHGVEVRSLEHVVQCQKSPSGRHPVTLTDDLDKRRRHVRDRRDPEMVGKSFEQGQVNGLRDRAKAQDPESDGISHVERSLAACASPRVR